VRRHVACCDDVLVALQLCLLMLHHSPYALCCCSGTLDKQHSLFNVYYQSASTLNTQNTTHQHSHQLKPNCRLCLIGRLGS
jgi:hypothetical protein